MAALFERAMNTKQMQQLEDDVLVRLVGLVQARADAAESRGGTASKPAGSDSRSGSKAGGILENRVAALVGMQDAAGADTSPDFQLAVSRLVSKRLVTRRRIANVEHSFFSLWPTEAGMARADYAKASLLGKMLRRLGTR